MLTFALRLYAPSLAWASGPLLSQAAKPDESATQLVDRSVEDLVTLAQRDNRAAQAELYRRFRGATHGLALSFLPPDAAGDVVQETFARALSRLSSLRDPARFGGWLLKIARNVALDALKDRRRQSDLPELGRSDPPRVEAARVLAILRTLPEHYSAPLLMRLVEGMSAKEIAIRTGLTPGSVRVNLHRGMMLLRDKLGEPNE